MKSLSQKALPRQFPLSQTNRKRDTHSLTRLTNIQSQLSTQNQNQNYGWQSQRPNPLRSRSMQPQILVSENQMNAYKELQRELSISHQRNYQKQVIEFGRENRVNRVMRSGGKSTGEEESKKIRIKIKKNKYMCSKGIKIV